MDAFQPETINDLEEIAKVMCMARFEKDFSDVYNNCRRECLDKCLMHKLFGLQKLSIEDVHNMSRKDLEDKIERWIRTFNVALNVLFSGERRLCDRIFFGFSSAADFSLMEISRESTIQLLNFFDYVSSGSHSPERLFKILEVFETLRDMIPEFASLFCDQYIMSLRNEATTIWKRRGKQLGTYLRSWSI
ncbi:putative exocyst complex component Exo70, cullin repeat-like-containing domain-containing protein [Medicago truncatula]|nr:putative exocyst complex component Exo70, cullin repeat-like-containing domain-containing protein [Medicago truncatula]